VEDELRPYWSNATKGRAAVVQAVPDMLEVVPLGTCKGKGVRVLLYHLGISNEKVPQISIHLRHLFRCLSHTHTHKFNILKVNTQLNLNDILYIPLDLIKDLFFMT